MSPDYKYTKNGVSVSNKGSGYPPSFKKEEIYSKTGEIPYTGFPEKKKDKSPYSDYFKKRNLGKKKVAKRRILRKGWIEEI